jgi:hypothetical protein
MSDPSIALQKALYARLKSALAPVPIYDRVPQRSEYPYVTLSGTTITANDYLNDLRDERALYLSVWSDYPGQKEVMEIMQVIHATLHRQPLTLETGYIVTPFIANRQLTREPDGQTYQGSVTLRVTLEY